MSMVVQKFGGSSLATTEKLQRVAERVVRTHAAGHDVVVVVSAMGNTTDELLALATKVGGNGALREVDLLIASGEQVSASLLSMAIRQSGVESVALTGPQAGIVTIGAHFTGRIREVVPDRILEELAKNRIVVVAGFQGANDQGELMTLGRGGSDTTAVAVAAAVEAERCEILSDVDGVYDADPRIVSEAARLESLTHEEMLELARHGAQVLNPRAVAYAREHEVTIYAGSAFEDGATRVGASRDRTERQVVGVACHNEVVWLRHPVGVSEPVLPSVLSDASGFLEHTHEDEAHVFLPVEQVADAEELVASIRASDDGVSVNDSVGTVSAIGSGIGAEPSFVHKGSRALTSAGVFVHEAIRGVNWMTCVVDRARIDPALAALHASLLGETKEIRVAI